MKCVESIGCPQSVVGEAIKGCESIGCSPLKCLPSQSEAAAVADLAANVTCSPTCKGWMERACFVAVRGTAPSRRVSLCRFHGLWQYAS